MIIILNAAIDYQADNINYCFYGFKFNIGNKIICLFTSRKALGLRNINRNINVHEYTHTHTHTHMYIYLRTF